MAEVAVEIMPASSLEVGVHGVGSVGLDGVGLEAAPTCLYGAAVHPRLVARVVYVRLQRLRRRPGLTHAPLPPAARRRWPGGCRRRPPTGLQPPPWADQPHRVGDKGSELRYRFESQVTAFRLS